MRIQRTAGSVMVREDVVRIIIELVDESSASPLQVREPICRTQ